MTPPTDPQASDDGAAALRAHADAAASPSTPPAQTRAGRTRWAPSRTSSSP
ncbi:hypothetical protein [Micrococcus sp.]|uniref:hypothetical protein n=1 Tax=Micrococcus sp. TaxID=1271 RepID=UPI002A90F4AC|nr:hypothetical protein [Micrococcus sp.]MDY6054436.1 hypothetical protein [Micrococcus sp.]